MADLRKAGVPNTAPDPLVSLQQRGARQAQSVTRARAEAVVRAALRHRIGSTEGRAAPQQSVLRRRLDEVSARIGATETTVRDLEGDLDALLSTAAGVARRTEV